LLIFKIKCVYFEEKNAFDEVDKIIEKYVSIFKIELHTKERNFEKSIADLVKECKL